MIYTLTLNPSLDLLMSLDKLNTGERNVVKENQLLAGGKGINVSLVLHELGVPSTALGFIAGMSGKEICRQLDDMGITHAFTQAGGYNRINVKLKAEQETEINGKGLILTPEEIAELIRGLDRMEEGDTLVISGSMPEDAPEDLIDWITGYIAFQGIRLVCDLHGKDLHRVIYRGPFLIKPNLAELEEFFEHSMSDEEDILRHAHRLQEMAEGNVLVSLGSDGAVFADESGNVYKEKAPRGILVNSVGSGDAMVAGFLHAYDLGYPSSEILRYAVACGSACAFTQRFAKKEEITALYNQMKRG
ncbi:MAG: 1-phosphofructokinase family hexose kinase [Solobacterium sp.]|nr:1-phosphofructokinase family hexose kinase [Solobacterium sp.]MBR2668739.1 1-phosphofructokinase family hexose kinase [Solobacterium sp.]